MYFQVKNCKQVGLVCFGMKPPSFKNRVPVTRTPQSRPRSTTYISCTHTSHVYTQPAHRRARQGTGCGSFFFEARLPSFYGPSHCGRPFFLIVCLFFFDQSCRCFLLAAQAGKGNLPKQGMADDERKKKNKVRPWRGRQKRISSNRLLAHRVSAMTRARREGAGKHRDQVGGQRGRRKQKKKKEEAAPTRLHKHAHT